MGFQINCPIPQLIFQKTRYENLGATHGDGVRASSSGGPPEYQRLPCLIITTPKDLSRSQNRLRPEGKIASNGVNTQDRFVLTRITWRSLRPQPKSRNRELTGLGELNEWLASGPAPRRRVFASCDTMIIPFNRWHANDN